MTDHLAGQSPVRCPVWDSPLSRLTSRYNEQTKQWEDMMVFKCKSCRGGVHMYTREWILRKWDELHQDIAERDGILTEKQEAGQ